MTKRTGIAPTIKSRSDVKEAADSYEKYHTSFGGDLEARKKDYADMVNKYYDLATSFYEYGWGTSFHFAHRWAGESHNQSIKRHEHYLALRLGLRPGSKCVDIGCGIGGPMREISLFSGAYITGINNNSYQIQRGQYYNEKTGHGLTEKCQFIKADFMKLPLEPNSYDAVYEIDATCHAPDAVACYKEIYRILKPGCAFAGYEWCSTDAYDPKNEEHRRILAEIELGNGLPTVRSTREVYKALQAAGFDVEEAVDLAETADIPWWKPLDPGFTSVSGFRTSQLGRFCTRWLVYGMEKMRLAPEGSCQVASFLERAGDSLVAGGKSGIFTTVYFFLARKPLDAK